jgi:hypothetical protein
MIKMDADPTRDFAGFKFDEIIEEAERRYRGYCTSFGVDPERTVSSRDTVGFWYARVAFERALATRPPDSPAATVWSWNLIIGKDWEDEQDDLYV